MTTRITEDNITPGSISANIFLAGVTLGGGVTIDQIIVTDSNFANTENTQIPVSGGYLKLYGTGFQANANVYISTSLSLSTQVTANVVSNNEIRLTIGSTTAATYNLFLFNRNGSTATRLNLITSAIPQRTASWVAGGNSPGDYLSRIERITYATDTATASVRGKLIVKRFAHAGIGTDNDAWYGAGNGGGPIFSSVERLTFISDTATASARGPLNSAVQKNAAVGNDNYGWFSTGPVTNRITYTNDTVTSTARGPLSANRYNLAGTSNDNYGWFGGGMVEGGSPRSVVDRVDFAADTNTASARGPLSIARWGLAGTGNNEYGWFGAGRIPGSVLSTVDRVTYSNDTATSSVRGPLSGREDLTASGNDNYGWFKGGNTPNTNIVQRIDFGSDTSAASTRGPLNINANWQLASASGIA